MRREEPCGELDVRRIYLVTGNKHKVHEINTLAEGSCIEFLQASATKLEVQSGSLGEIALTAARHAFDQIRAPLVVDDSGLFIESLGGFPGPYSSFVYKTIGISGILRLLEGESDRKACFVTAAALIIPPLERVFYGRTCGQITREPRGRGGFGFDPIFLPDGSRKTYAEMSTEEKNTVSHRARAFKKLISYLELLYYG
ncbi:MAG: XTP/dITP diphosphatase [Desulfurococcales archaeon]|nr:XTP/dITP diphosphatase [Desulfurococcales archaeon]